MWSRGQGHLGDGLRHVIEGVNLVVMEDNPPPLLLRQLLLIVRLRTPYGSAIVRRRKLEGSDNARQSYVVHRVIYALAF